MGRGAGWEKVVHHPVKNAKGLDEGDRGAEGEYALGNMLVWRKGRLEGSSTLVVRKEEKKRRLPKHKRQRKNKQKNI